MGGVLVVLDVHARERLEDAAEQHLHVAVVAGVVLGDDLAEPVIVPGVGGLPRLPVAERLVLVGHGGQALEDEAELDRHRLLAPQRAVVVEHGHPLGRRHVADPVGGGHGLDEPDDGLPGPGVVPGRRRVSRRRHLPLA
jgi:hypothetical protein